jgi:hypothetical protein
VRSADFTPASRSAFPLTAGAAIKINATYFC